MSICLKPSSPFPRPASPPPLILAPLPLPSSAAPPPLPLRPLRPRREEEDDVGLVGEQGIPTPVMVWSFDPLPLPAELVLTGGLTPPALPGARVVLLLLMLLLLLHLGLVFTVFRVMVELGAGVNVGDSLCSQSGQFSRAHGSELRSSPPCQVQQKMDSSEVYEEGTGVQLFAASCCKAFTVL